MKTSVRSTYDSRETGPRYRVTTRINDSRIGEPATVEDPFVRHTVRLSVLDMLRGLIRMRLDVEVTVSADPELMYDVLELDDNTLIHGRTRQAAFRQSMHQKLSRFVQGENQ